MQADSALHGVSISFKTSDLALITVTVALNINEGVSFVSSNKMIFIVEGMDSYGSDTRTLAVMLTPTVYDTPAPSLLTSGKLSSPCATARQITLTKSCDSPITFQKCEMYEKNRFMKRITIRTACIVLAVWIGVFITPAIRHPLSVAIWSTLVVLLGVLLLSIAGKEFKRYQRRKRRS